MTIDNYISQLDKRFKLGNATEHTFRGDLQNLIETIAPEIAATNEPKRISCGAPDYVITKKNIPVGYIEAKDIGTDLNNKILKEQFDRYKKSLDNLIITDYLEFQLFIDGVIITSIRIAEIDKGVIVAKPENFSSFENLIKDFCSHVGQTIKSSKKLAEMMAGKARMLSDVIGNALTNDEDKSENSTLRDQMTAFKQILIHDIKPKEFADVYAQTIAYGMFAARLHDITLDTFTRQEAAELIPKSNPFLRKLFGYIAGPDIDDRIIWIVDGLADIFRAADVASILKNFGKSTQTQDPIIHFYETFLSEYDPKLRKSRGVWYTPESVVNFIVRAVDDILKNEFNLPEGIADTSKTKIKVDLHGKKVEQEVHRVQILDPATGTGTFLAEVIKQIYSKFEGQKGIWSNYVENHLLPRLNGFELLMASYAMAHLKLDMLLTETGYKPTREQRFKVYLTNSLEEHHPETGTLFANWLSSEANEANQIKRDTPVMCVIGNPPYAVSSSNKNEWIIKLIEDYKIGLNERKLNLDDDYIKFIRYGQFFIEKNQNGILAYISNNSFIDGITHRQMRKSLLSTFDDIYILDLHGNSNKKETCPDGSIDQNVFDIMQGVSINIFIKNNSAKKPKLANVYHYDLQGKREEKYKYLTTHNAKNIKWRKLKYAAPNYFFTYKDFGHKVEYDKGFKLDDLFIKNGTGFETQQDELVISFEKYSIDDKKRELELVTPQNEKTKRIIKDLQNATIQKVLFKVFDYRYTLYSKNSSGVMGRPKYDLLRNMMNDNYCLLSTRLGTDGFSTLISKSLVAHKSITAYDKTVCFPLYIYPELFSQSSILSNIRTPNLNKSILNNLEIKLNIKFESEFDNRNKSFCPIHLMDYIYGVFHSPKYREKYKEFLKIDFPRVPYPKDQQTFWELVKLGCELRQIHLLESPIVNKYLTQYPIDGSNVVTKPVFKDGKVYINETQYFDGVPQIAWEFYIGGYQPAQKWLKDRKDRKLEFEDILHYQKIIVALIETDRIMKLIDKINLL